MFFHASKNLHGISTAAFLFLQDGCSFAILILVVFGGMVILRLEKDWLGQVYFIRYTFSSQTAAVLCARATSLSQYLVC